MSTSRLRRQEIVVHALRKCADIGDKDVETPERCRGFSHPVTQRLDICDIGDAAPSLHPFAGKRRDGLVHCRFVARAQRHVAALVRQQLGDRAADAARAAGDDCILAFEIEIHTSLLSADLPVL
jgi:hypothetical protein